MIPCFLQKKSDDSQQVLPDKPDPLAVEKVRAADIEADLKRRVDLAKRFAVQGPTFARDLVGINQRFLKWFTRSHQSIRDDLAAYWEREASSHPDISHQHDRGQHARMTMVIEYAAERHGYEIQERT